MVDLYLRTVPAFANANDLQLTDPDAEPANGTLAATLGSVTLAASGSVGSPPTSTGRLQTSAAGRLRRVM